MNTPPLTLTERRRKWSDNLRQAEWWISHARKEAKRGRYDKSRSDTMMACCLLDEACQYETEVRDDR